MMIRKAMIIMLFLGSVDVYSMSCEEAKTYVPTPNADDYRSAKQLRAFELKNYERQNVRNLEDIAIVIAKARQVKMLSTSCNIPMSQIDLDKYYELTGRRF